MINIMMTLRGPKGSLQHLPHQKNMSMSRRSLIEILELQYGSGIVASESRSACSQPSNHDHLSSLLLHLSSHTYGAMRAHLGFISYYSKIPFCFLQTCEVTTKEQLCISHTKGFKTLSSCLIEVVFYVDVGYAA